MRQNRVLFRAVTAAALLVGLVSGLDAARADYFTYQTGVSVSNVKVNGQPLNIDGPVKASDTPLTFVTPGQTPISMTGLSSPAGETVRDDARGEGTDIVFGEITASTLTTSKYENISFGFTYTLNLTDYSQPGPAGVATGVNSIEITGMLSGSVGDGRKVNLNNLKSYTTNPANGLVQVGDTRYQVTLTLADGGRGFTPPGTSWQGRFSAHIRAVPEPGSLALIGLGGALGLAGIIRRRRASAA